MVVLIHYFIFFLFYISSFFVFHTFLDSFFDHFERKGKARISLEAAIYNDTCVMKIDPETKPSVRFSGQYAILKS